MGCGTSTPANVASPATPPTNTVRSTQNAVSTATPESRRRQGDAQDAAALMGTRRPEDILAGIPRLKLSKDPSLTIDLRARKTGLQQLESLPPAGIADPLVVLETLVETFGCLPHQDGIVRIRLLRSIALYAHAVYVGGKALPAEIRDSMRKKLEDAKGSMDADAVFGCEFDYELDSSLAALQLSEDTNTLAKQASTYGLDLLKLVAYGVGLAELPKAAAEDAAARMKEMWQNYCAEWYREVCTSSPPPNSSICFTINAPQVLELQYLRTVVLDASTPREEALTRLCQICERISGSNDWHVLYAGLCVLGAVVSSTTVRSELREVAFYGTERCPDIGRDESQTKDFPGLVSMDTAEGMQSVVGQIKESVLEGNAWRVRWKLLRCCVDIDQDSEVLCHPF